MTEPKTPIFVRPAAGRPRVVDYFVEYPRPDQMVPLRMAYRAFRKSGMSPLKARHLVSLVATTRTSW